MAKMWLETVVKRQFVSALFSPHPLCVTQLFPGAKMRAIGKEENLVSLQNFQLKISATCQVEKTTSKF